MSELALTTGEPHFTEIFIFAFVYCVIGVLVKVVVPIPKTIYMTIRVKDQSNLEKIVSVLIIPQFFFLSGKLFFYEFTFFLPSRIW